MKRMTVWTAIVLMLSMGIASAQQGERSKVFGSDKVRAALDALLPTGVDIDAVQVEGSLATVTGLASDTVQLSQFMRRINDAAEFETPDLVSVSNADGMSLFTLAAQMKCPITADEPPSSLCSAAPATKAPLVFKCRINGTISFQGQPCPAGSEV
jgi:hypothetical protein